MSDLGSLMGDTSSDSSAVPSTGGGDLLGSLTAGLFNLGGGFLNNLFGKKSSKKAFERNLALWQIENDYNKPVNQMARLKEAGLNPNLVYDRGATTLAASTHGATPQSNPSPYQLDALQVLNAYQNIKQVQAQTAYINAQTALLRQEANDNAETGTSRGTPFPVKAVKHYAGNIEKYGKKLGKHLNSGGDSSLKQVVDAVDDFLSGHYVYEPPSKKRVKKNVGSSTGTAKDISNWIRSVK